jgi:YVTN family beta-propeller protein
MQVALPTAGVPKGAAISEAAPSPQPKPEANVYAGTTFGLAQAVADIAPRVYVPNEKSGSVSIIDPVTLTVVGKIKVGAYPQHVTPSWDLSKLYVNDSGLTEIDARTGTVVRSIPVPLPYNLYFTLDGTKAIVVAEEASRLDFYDSRSWKALGSVRIPWSGIDHLDMSADGSYLLATCEFSGRVVKVDTERMTLVSDLTLAACPST